MLGTPRVVALGEEAHVRRASPSQLAAGQTTVGMRVQLDHLAPTAVGAVGAAEATLEKVEGRRLTSPCTVNDRGLVAAGKVTRVVVRRDDFLKAAE